MLLRPVYTCACHPVGPVPSAGNNATEALLDADTTRRATLDRLVAALNSTLGLVAESKVPPFEAQRIATYLEVANSGLQQQTTRRTLVPILRRTAAVPEGDGTLRQMRKGGRPRGAAPLLDGTAAVVAIDAMLTPPEPPSQVGSQQPAGSSDYQSQSSIKRPREQAPPARANRRRPVKRTRGADTQANTDADDDTILLVTADDNDEDGATQQL